MDISPLKIGLVLLVIIMFVIAKVLDARLKRQPKLTLDNVFDELERAQHFEASGETASTPDAPKELEVVLIYGLLAITYATVCVSSIRTETMQLSVSPYPENYEITFQNDGITRWMYHGLDIDYASLPEHETIGAHKILETVREAVKWHIGNVNTQPQTSLEAIA